MIVAALIITVSIIGIFATQRESTVGIEMQDLAHRIADSVNGFYNLNGNTMINFTFNPDKVGVYLPTLINGNSYKVQITPNIVVLTQSGKQATADFLYRVHLWKPTTNNYTLSQIDTNDKGNTTLDINSGVDFTIKRVGIQVSGLLDYYTFIYKTT